jgi:hypothetical protein
MIHIISLGAGVQSSTMALMAARGLIEPMPRCAIFADTGWEPNAVYGWLTWLEEQLPFPVHRVSKGNIRADQVVRFVAGRVNGERRFASLPYFTKEDGNNKIGRTSRQCTAEYKIEPIESFIRHNILNLESRQRAPKKIVISQWRGISADEAQRMKPSRNKWMMVRYPLAMELGMTRADCLAWMQRMGYPKPPRSACIGCPFHSNSEWLRMQRDMPGEFADAVQFDNAIRKAGGMRADTFLHRSCRPLGEIDFELETSKGNLDLWGNECEGMCGV